MPVYRTPAAVDAYSRLAPAPTRVLLATETGQPRAPEQARLYCLTHRFVDWKQARTMRWEDKENASPQMSHAADSPGPAKALLAQNTAKTPQGAGVKNRFGYTPSPGTQTAPLGSAERVPEAAPKAQAFTLDLSAATAPSAKQIISEMSESARSARQDNGGGVAMTISWTPQKVVKKPVLKEREPVARIRKQEEVATKARTFADRKPQERADNAVKSKAAAAKTVPKERALGKSVAIKQTVGKVADKKAFDSKKAVTEKKTGPKVRASLAGTAQNNIKKDKAAGKQRRQTFADRWEADDSEVAGVNDGTRDGAKSISEKLMAIRMEHGCSMGEARIILWKNTWPQKDASNEDVVLAPDRPADPVADQFGEEVEAVEENERASSAPSTPTGTKVDNKLRAAQDDLPMEIGFTPGKAKGLPTPGRRHSLLYSPSFAKMRSEGTRANGALLAPAEIIRRATGGTAPMRASPLAELDTSDALGQSLLTASPVGVASPKDDDESESVSDDDKSPRETGIGGGSGSGGFLGRLAAAFTGVTEPASDTVPVASPVASPADATTKVVEVPGPERIVEKIVEVPVERLVMTEVPVYIDRVVEVDKVVNTVKEVPVDRVVTNQVCVPVDRVVNHEVEVIKEVIVEKEKIVEVESESLKAELATCMAQKEQLLDERLALEDLRDQLQKQHDFTREALVARAKEVSELTTELESLRQDADRASEVAAELTSVKEAEASLKMELASKKSALAEIEEKYAATVQQLSNAEDKLRSESEARSALETRYNTTINDFQDQLLRAQELESDLASLAHEKKCLQEEVEKLTVVLGEREADAAELKARLSAAEAAAIEDSTTTAKMREELAAAEEERQAVLAKVTLLQDEAAALSLQIEGVDGEKAAAIARADELEKKCTALEVEKEEVVDMLDAANAGKTQLQQQLIDALEREGAAVAAAAEAEEKLCCQLAEADAEHDLAFEKLQAAKDELMATREELEAVRTATADASMHAANAEVRLLNDKLMAAEAAVQETTASHSGALRVLKEQLEVAQVAAKEGEAAGAELDNLRAAMISSATTSATTRSKYKAGAAVALCASAFVSSIPLFDRAVCPAPNWNTGALTASHPLVRASAVPTTGEMSLQRQLNEVREEVARRNAQLAEALRDNASNAAGRVSAEAMAAALQETSAALKSDLQVQAEKASVADRLVEALKQDAAAAKSKEIDLLQKIAELRKLVPGPERAAWFRRFVPAEQPVLDQVRVSRATGDSDGRVRALRQYGIYAGSLW